MFRKWYILTHTGRNTASIFGDQCSLLQGSVKSQIRRGGKLCIHLQARTFGVECANNIMNILNVGHFSDTPCGTGTRVYWCSSAVLLHVNSCVHFAQSQLLRKARSCCNWCRATSTHHYNAVLGRWSQTFIISVSKYIYFSYAIRRRRRRRRRSLFMQHSTHNLQTCS